MDFLNRAFIHVKDLFLSLSPAMRAVAFLLLAAVVLGLGFLFVGQFHGGANELLGGRAFDASEINAAQRAFAKAGLSGARIEGSRIRVPRGEEAAYVAALADEGVMPSDFHVILEKALAKISPFTPPKQRDEIVKNAREQELSNIIRQMQGIEKAGVLFDRRRLGGLTRREIVTASVTVFPKLGEPLPRRRITMIRKLVASSIAGLTPDNVNVVVDGMSGEAADEWEGKGSEYYEAMRHYQKMIETKVLTALSFVPNVRVVANVELNAEVESTEETSKVDDKNKAAITQAETTSQSSRGSQPSGGSPGLDAQTSTPNRGQVLGTRGKAQSSSERSSDVKTQFEPSRSVRRTRTAGLTPKSVSVTVSVPSSYYDNVREELKRRYEGFDPPRPAPSPDTIAQDEQTKIQTAVANVIGAFQTDKTALAQQVHVASFTQIPRPQPPDAPMTDVTLGWLSRYWTTLGLFGLSAFGLVMLRSMVKSIPPPGPAPEPITPSGQDDSDATGAKGGIKLQPPAANPTMRDELTDIVRADPEAAANVLRGWIGRSP